MSIPLDLGRRLLCVKRTQLEMVRDRGFDISAEKVLLDSYDPDIPDPGRRESIITAFITYYSNLAATQTAAKQATQQGVSKKALKVVSFRNVLSNAYYRPRDNTTLYVYYTEGGTSSGLLGKEQFTEFLDTIHTAGYLQSILITSGGLSSDTKSEMNSVVDRTIQHFTEGELIINVTKHYLVPKHTLLTREEKAEYFKSTQGLTPQKLARIKVSDAQARYYGAQVGDLFNIDRIDISGDTLVDTYPIKKIVIPDT